MFFEKEMIYFNILDVMELDQSEINLFNSGRNFNALSFRIRSDAVLKTEAKEYVMRDGSVAFVPARLDYARVAGADRLIVIHFNATNYQAKEIECFESTHPDRLELLFGRILECWRGKEIGYKYQCAAILYEIFAECYTQNFRPQQSISKIRASVDYILESYTNPELTVGEAAKRSFMSEVYFRRLFKAEYGTSPQKYIVDLRIQHAAGLISTGYYSLKEVALMSGYNDYKYFSVEFKRIIGISPSEYSYNYQN